MFATVIAFFKDNKAATSIEYSIIAAGIAVAIVAVVQGLGTKLKASYTSVDNALG
jgi:pilus assembly protein Flp/PilA